MKKLDKKIIKQVTKDLKISEDKVQSVYYQYWRFLGKALEDSKESNKITIYKLGKFINRNGKD